MLLSLKKVGHLTHFVKTAKLVFTQRQSLLLGPAKHYKYIPGSWEKYRNTKLYLFHNERPKNILSYDIKRAIRELYQT
jgi:hypothetical protein